MSGHGYEYDGDRNLDNYVEELKPIENGDEIFDPVLKLRRRMTIRYLSLCTPEAVIPVNELARVCAAVERDEPSNSLTNSDYNHVRTGLKDRDWPILEEYGIVETIDEIEVCRGERFEFYDSLLDAVYERS
jgi:hypothetical protein